MGSYTAQILIGEEHQNHGGLLPGSIRQMFLSENSRAVWTFFGDRPLTANPVATWIPERPETILADGLLMVAYFVARDETIKQCFAERGIDPVVNQLELGKLPKDLLSATRFASRGSRLGERRVQKMVIAAFQQSSVVCQVDVLSGYAMHFELLLPTNSYVALPIAVAN